MQYPAMHKNKPHIAVLVDTSSGWGRRIIRGIANYGLKHGPWQLAVEERGMQEHMHLLPDWDGDGIIARISDQSLLNELIATGKPVVNVSAIELGGTDLPRVTSDYSIVAQQAVEHFRERGFSNLAYCGPNDLNYVKRHCTSFTEAAAKQDLPCHIFHSKLKGRKRTWHNEKMELQAWLENLPKPIGILAWGTSRARELLTACSESGLSVPEQVAVLAGDDDDLLCEVCSPPLSGIITSAEPIGYEAARILDSLLRCAKAPKAPVLMPPLGIHLRQSSDTLAIEDKLLSQAILFIRENAHRCIQVSDVADEVGISRRSLERRFESVTGRSPAREIQQAHLKRAQHMLKNTDLSIADVAANCGYGSTEYMIGVFRKTFGRTPLKYRSWVRAT